jgi:hypothetical protein
MSGGSWQYIINKTKAKAKTEAGVGSRRQQEAIRKRYGLHAPCKEETGSRHIR